jgi:ArsR family transcriptional regulator, arsenate/arsenite/antimonite-responsive transcriptional repressor
MHGSCRYHPEQYLALLLNIAILPPQQTHQLSKTTKMTLAEQELEDFDRVFKALAHPSRRSILTVLQARGGKMNAGDIVSRLSFAWPTITRHLQQLEQAGLISSDKEGREQYYTLNGERLKTVVDNWMKWFN